MPISSSFGRDYSKWFSPGEDEAELPFARPTNRGQEVINARARAERGGDPIGSGYLNDEGTLEDPDRGLMRVVGEHPWLGPLIAIGGPLAATAVVGGPAALGFAGTGAPTATTATTAGGLLPVTTSVSPTAAALLPPGAAGATGGGMGWGSILSAIKNPKNLLDLGTMLGSRAQTGANNRGALLEALLAEEAIGGQNDNNYYDNLTARSVEDRASQTDAWRKLQQGDYVAQGTGPQTPMLSPYSKAITPRTSPELMAGAEALRTAAQNRLVNGSPLPAITRRTFTAPDDVLHPGTAEKIFDTGSSLAQIIGFLRGGRK